MHHVVAATTNPAKIRAILHAFNEIFGENASRIDAIAVESGVPEQPMGSKETLEGARNRVENARHACPKLSKPELMKAARLAGSSSKVATSAAKPALPPCPCLR